MFQIENVYQGNLMQTFEKIHHIIKKYKYVAIDTEFPGYF